MVRTLDDDEYRMRLKMKLMEEVMEYQESGSLEELADIYEVIRALAAAEGMCSEELETLRRSQCVFYPQRDQAACDADYRQWRRAVERARSWIENDM